MYSIDLKKVSIHVYSILKSLRKTAFLLKVSHSSIQRWLINIEKKKYTFKNKILKSDQIVEIIKSTILINPLITLKEFQNDILKLLNINVSKELIRIVILKNNFSRKNINFYGKSKNHLNKEIDFLNKRKQFIEENKNIICLDEVSFGRNTKNIKGYSLKNQRIEIMKKKPIIITKSFIVSIDENKIISKTYKYGSFNSVSFLDFIKFSNFKNCVILLDNVSFHHSKEFKNYCFLNNIELLYTPPYSPWYNPIEYCFSIIKRNYYKDYNIENAFLSLKKEHINAFFRKSINFIK